jgi:hypothetical protein
MHGAVGVACVDSMTITFYRETRARYDLTNAAESVLDAMVDAGILLDDNAQEGVDKDGNGITLGNPDGRGVITSVMLERGGVDKAEPRAEVCMTWVEPEKPKRKASK